MEVNKAVYSALEKVTGLTKSDFDEYKEENLVEVGIIDSMSSVSLLNEISNLCGKKVTIDKFTSGDFATVENIISAVSRLL